MTFVSMRRVRAGDKLGRGFPASVTPKVGHTHLCASRRGVRRGEDMAKGKEGGREGGQCTRNKGVVAPKWMHHLVYRSTKGVLPKRFSLDIVRESD